MFKLFKFLKPYWLQVTLLLIATVVQVYCTLRLPYLMANIINDGINAKNLDLVWQIGFQMLGLVLISALGSFAANYFSANISANFSRDLRAAVFVKTLNLDLENVKNFSTASLLTRTTNDVNQVQQSTVMILSLMLRAPLFCIISIIMAIQTAPNMTWIIAVGVIAILGSIILIMSLVIPKFKIFQSLVDKITLLTRENLTGLRVIRAFNNEKYEQKKFAKSNREMTKLLIFIDKVLELQNPLINIIFNGTTLLCYWVGISIFASGNPDMIGNMTAFAEYVTHIMMSFLMLSILLVMLPRANVSAGRINELLKTKSKIVWQPETVGIANQTPSVSFKNVSFGYADADEKILSDISFEAKAGEITAFVGSTGSGKSTLINLVPRFYEPTAGKIEINGLPIENYSKTDLMKNIGFVPQRGVLFSGNVSSNIAFGAPNATSAEIHQAAEISQSYSFIEKLPKKFHSPIAQGGTNVSGGQKQRLSIARALCKKPKILVFDDSFSALDMKTDQKLRAALKPVIKSSAVLIVAQRISTIKDADQIIVLDNGKVVGKGKHYDLLKNCSVYADIVKSQLSEQEFQTELAYVKN